MGIENKNKSEKATVQHPLLIDSEKLHQALTDISFRNYLFKELRASGENQFFELSRLILALWLGDNSLGKKIRQNFPAAIRMGDGKYVPVAESEFYGGLGYESFVQLEIAIRRSHHIAPLASSLLLKTYQALLDYFNANYIALFYEPDTLLAKFREIVNDHITTAVLTSFPFLKNVKDHLFDKTKVLYKIFSKDDVFIGSCIDRKLISVQTTKAITGTANSFMPYGLQSFYGLDYSELQKAKLHAQVVFIETKDNHLLNGLLISSDTQTDTIVLALIGHFQAEDIYLSGRAEKWHELFSHDVVLINHRNYSQRSHQSAESCEVLAQDIIAYYDYFQRQEKNIVLYGMCGGANQMLMAAHALAREHHPFKLIIDRSSKQHSNFIDKKTWERYLNIDPEFFPSIRVNNYFKKPYLRHILFFLYSPIYFSIYALLTLTKNNPQLGALIQAIPEQDVLVLQAKSKKVPGQLAPTYTDLEVHPQNDLRTALKDRRRLQKQVINNLIHLCEDIRDVNQLFHNGFTAFVEFIACLKLALTLIDDEKLQSPREPISEINNLHPMGLYHLETRHYRSMPLFLNGFFGQPQEDCKKLLLQFVPAEIDLIGSTLDQLFPKQKATSKVMAGKIDNLLRSLNQHHDLIGYFCNRIQVMKLHDTSAVIKKMLKIPLLQALQSNLMREPDCRNSRPYFPSAF